jgi:serine/threonine-protein kinase
LVQVAVPDVINQTQQAAEALLRSKNFIVGTITTQPSDAAAGLVVSQDPAANANAAPGSAVNLVISASKGTTPNVVGEPAAQAVTDMKNAGYATVTQTQETSATIPSGSVIRSTPASGQPVPKSKAATIVVSSGKAQSVVPSVLGQTQSSANAALKAKGFLVQVTFVDGVAPNQVGRVIDQSPAGLSQADPGSTVVIDVGRSTSTSTSSTSTTR